jgi:CubicO group peptidase (beta-lactamase class C family)
VRGLLTLGVWAACLAGQEQAQERPTTYPSPDAVRAILTQRIDEEKRGVGIVVGIVDAGGMQVITHGASAREGGRPLDGDTVFEIGSITKVFTGILLADMVRKGEVFRDDKISAHLPADAKLPARDGKEITLASLATHTSGLPRLPSNLVPKDPTNPYVDYAEDDLYAFLAKCKLGSDVGAAKLYSNVGYGLLGHILARKAGIDYGSLVAQRITAPLGMTSTAIALSEEQRARFAQGHDQQLRAVPAWDFDVLAGAGALRSTAHDMLRFLAANLGLGEATALRETLDLARAQSVPIGENGEERSSLAWGPPAVIHGTRIEWHNGGTGGFRSFAGMDAAAGRGVVVLTNCTVDCDDIGCHLLEPRYAVRAREAKRR